MKKTYAKFEKKLKRKLEDLKVHYRQFNDEELKKQKLIVDYIVELQFKEKNKDLVKYLSKKGLLNLILEDELLTEWVLAGVAVDLILKERKLI